MRNGGEIAEAYNLHRPRIGLMIDTQRTGNGALSTRTHVNDINGTNNTTITSNRSNLFRTNRISREISFLIDRKISVKTENFSQTSSLSVPIPSSQMSFSIVKRIHPNKSNSSRVLIEVKNKQSKQITPSRQSLPSTKSKLKIVPTKAKISSIISNKKMSSTGLNR